MYEPSEGRRRFDRTDESNKGGHRDVVWMRIIRSGCPGMGAQYGGGGSGGASQGVDGHLRLRFLLWTTGIPAG